MTLKYPCNANTKCTYLYYAAEADSTEVFSLAVRDRFILLLLLLLIFLLPHLLFLGLYTQTLARTTFIRKEIFYIIIFKQATGFLDQLNEVKPLPQFFSKVCTIETSVFLFVALEFVRTAINTFRVDTCLNNAIYCTKILNYFN